MKKMLFYILLCSTVASMQGMIEEKLVSAISVTENKELKTVTAINIFFRQDGTQVNTYLTLHTESKTYSDNVVYHFDKSNMSDKKYRQATQKELQKAIKNFIKSDKIKSNSEEYIKIN